MRPIDLRKRRVALGLTQNELAGRFGVSRQTVNNWENEHTRAPRWVADQLDWIMEAIQAENMHVDVRHESVAQSRKRRGPYRVDNA